MSSEFFIEDEIYGERLLISKMADQTELADNIRVARVLLNSFEDMYIRINEHLIIIGHKNPEYTINGKLGDRKGVESENGIKSAFRKARRSPPILRPTHNPICVWPRLAILLQTCRVPRPLPRMPLSRLRALKLSMACS